MKTDDMIAFIEALEDYSGFISKEMSGDKKEFKRICEEIIEYFKSTQKSGRWVGQKSGGYTPGGNRVCECSECGWVFGSHMITPNYSYCPNCGAEMEHKGGNVMKLDEAIAWLTTEGRFDMEGHCCPKSSEAVNTLLDALRNGEIFTFEEIEAVPKAFHDKCMQIEIAKRMKLERPKGEWIKMSDSDGVYWACSECGENLPRVVYRFDPRFDLFPTLKSIDKTKFCPHCGAEMWEDA